MKVTVGFCYCLSEPCSVISSYQTLQLIEQVLVVTVDFSVCAGIHCLFQLQFVLVSNSDVLFGLEARFLGPTGKCQVNEAFLEALFLSLKLSFLLVGSNTNGR